MHLIFYVLDYPKVEQFGLFRYHLSKKWSSLFTPIDNNILNVLISGTNCSEKVGLDPADEI